MPKVLGTIAEYNPFHNGHLYHIKKSIEETGADFCNMCDVRKFCTKR